MKTILILIVALISTNVNAMRCGNNLITRGDPTFKLIEACGEPRHQAMNTLYYKRDGMMYTVKYDQKQIITDIEENIL